MSLLDTNLLTRLDRLKIITQKPLPGRFKGDLRSPKKGGAVEFADFRDYVPGDDLRTVDWNIYARLERPYVKLFEEEEDTSVRILVDCSKSMNWGDPNKLEYAKKLSGCLGYIALRNLIWTSVYGFSNGIKERFSPHRGPAFIPLLFDFLEGLKPGGETNLPDACRQIISEKSPFGLIFVISDLFDSNFENALGYLGDRYRDVKVIHLLSPQELEPVISGDLRLVDVETGRKVQASISPMLLNRYKENLAAWRETTRRACHKRGMDYVPVDTTIPIDTLILRTFRERGFLA